MCLVALAVVAVGCAPAEQDVVVLEGVALAGPVCPVVTDPPDPACDDRPVAGAAIELRTADGSVAATAVTNADGTFRLEAPAGSYELVAGEVAGLMGTPAPITIDLQAGIGPVTLSYDTGIR
jgi:hypothetical protein